MVLHSVRISTMELPNKLHWKAPASATPGRKYKKKAAWNNNCLGTAVNTSILQTLHTQKVQIPNTSGAQTIKGIVCDHLEKYPHATESPHHETQTKVVSKTMEHGCRMIAGWSSLFLRFGVGGRQCSNFLT